MASESPQFRRPTRAQLADPQRNSNVVRASVLETALELGFSQNSTVADWIFNNPLSEEPEDSYAESDNRSRHDTKSERAPDIVEAITPSFTSGSNSASDESCSLKFPGNNVPSAAVTTIQVHTHKPSVTESPHVHFGDFSSDQLQLFSPFALSPHDVRHGGTRGNSLGKLPRDNERPHSQEDSFRRNPSHESASPGSADTGYASEGQYLSKGKAGKGKDKPGKLKANKGSKPKTHDTSQAGEKDGDYMSDGGYLSASSNKSLGKSPGKVKSRAMALFRRKPKKTGRVSDDEDEDGIPPVPAIPTLPRPSSPKPLERRVAPSSPTRPGFFPLSLNLTNPPASPPRRVSKSPPPPHTGATPLQRSDHFSAPQRSASSLATSASAPAILTPAATIPLPASMPGTPLSTASFPSTPSPPTQLGAGAGSTPKPLLAPSSRQHLGIPPPAPPPTLPLPQLPPSPSTSPNAMSLPVPATPTPLSRRVAPGRPIPVVPMVPGSTRPLTPRGAASPFRPLLSPRAIPTVVLHSRNGQLSNGSEVEQHNCTEVIRRQRSGTGLSAGLGSTPAFLQRRIQHGPPPSPRHPPPDIPLPPSPCPTPNVRPRTPIGSPSKFHEHFSSVSSVPSSRALSIPTSMSPSPSTATLSGSSSGPSVRSSHASSTSDRSKGPVIRDSLNRLEYSRPTTSASTVSEASYGRPVTSTFSRPAMDVNSQVSDRSDVSSSIYSPTTHRDSSSATTYDDDDDADPDDTAPKSYVDEEDDDASVYPSEDKTAGRRTMYLVEHGELDENGDQAVLTGNHYWGGHEVPPPLPPLPPLSTQPGPGYF